MKKLTLLILLAGTLITLVFFGNYWVNTQPIWVSGRSINNDVLTQIPAKNKQIIDLIEANGKNIAPTYHDAVCTEFVIKVITEFDALTNDEKNAIRIITKENLNDLVSNESSIIKGVQTALVHGNHGIEISKFEDVKPGDLVQFWNTFHGKEYGHCGVVLNIEANKKLTLYSSHPLTDGYGKQTYLWPDHTYFVRLK